MSEFLPGDLVLCVDTTPSGSPADSSLVFLQVGSTYTIEDTIVYKGLDGVVLVEIKSCHYTGAYQARRFILLCRPSEFKNQEEFAAVPVEV